MSTLISILSTDHGRLRREQRDIRKRDLCKALKYGKRERCWGQRWKIEYDGIIFIVNNSLTQEVTAYPSPLALAPIDTKDHILQNRTRDLFKLKPELVTTHTVLVVDTSGSMTKHDINLHRDRQTAAYSVTAMEFVAEQLFMQTATNSDIVSVIEFNSEATEVISKEPCSWVLYNKLLSRSDGRTFKARENEHFRDTYHGDSNYIPALEAADKILGSIDHDCCALSMLFLSDGSPTDATALGLTPLAAKRLMAKKVTEISVKYQEKLNIQMVGFGAPCQDFSVLEQLAEAALSTKSGTKANFTYCGKVADEIGSAVSNLVSSTTATKIQLLKHDRGKTRTKRKMELESRTKGEKICFNYFKICGHYVYNPMKNDFQVFDDLPPGAVIGGELDVEYRHDSSKSKMPPPLLAISKNPCGQGAERLAFRCHLSRKSSEEGFVFNAMVAKETILVERPDDNIQFHKEFCKAQNLSGYLAIEFNHRLKALPWYCETFTPTIVFLPCSVLTLDDPEWHGRGVLVEKRLNTEKYPWRKYNDNAGVRTIQILATFPCISCRYINNPYIMYLYIRALMANITMLLLTLKLNLPN